MLTSLTPTSRAVFTIAAQVSSGKGTPFLVRSARVAFGGLSYKPWRSAEAEAALLGAPASRASFDAPAVAALRKARGYGHNDFKIPLARRTLRATLTQAAGLA